MNVADVLDKQIEENKLLYRENLELKRKVEELEKQLAEMLSK